jgi:hypothetical protein
MNSKRRFYLIPDNPIANTRRPNIRETAVFRQQKGGGTSPLLGRSLHYVSAHFVVK